jgi:hypothetical protein
MNFFEDILTEKPRIERAIKKYGYAPEHNFWWYKSQAEKNSKNIYVGFDDGTGLLTIEERDKKRSAIFSSPIAPPLRRASIIIEYLERMFRLTEIQKVTLELETALYKELLDKLPCQIKARAIKYTLTWPVYDLKNFNLTLTGKHWKTLRKEKNKFYQNHCVSVADSLKYKDKKALRLILDEWRKKRGGHDRTYFIPYYNFIINGNCMGTSEARVFVVNGKAVGINAGWLIPNNNRFYGAIGIHDYSLPDLGDVLYLEDLAWLKAHGCTEADMGGGEEALTNFKNKFQPKLFYKTHIFSVVKR